MAGSAHGQHLRHVVPPRPAPPRQPGAARGLRRRRGRPAVRPRPAPVGSRPGQVRRAYLAASLRSLDDSLGGSPRRPPGRPARRGARRGPRGRGADRAPRRRLRALRLAPRRGGHRGAARAPGRDPAPRLAVRRGAGAGAERQRRPLQGLHARSSGPGPTTAGATPSTPRRAQTWADAALRRASPTRRRRRAPRSPTAGEKAALRAWKKFLDGPVDDYDDGRDIPGGDGVSRMSTYLRWGEIHPRTMLRRPGAEAVRLVGDLPQGAGLARVLRRRAVAPPRERAPGLPRELLGDGRTTTRASRSRPGRRARRASRSSTPGCGSCVATGFMHNRVRMIVASFLVKDLHVWWRHGARHFMEWLADGDLAVQPAQLAVGGRLRHRRGAVLPDLQPDLAGQEVRPGRRPTSGAGCRSWRTCPPKEIHEPQDVDGLPGADRGPQGGARGVAAPLREGQGPGLTPDPPGPSDRRRAVPPLSSRSRS